MSFDSLGDFAQQIIDTDGSEKPVSGLLVPQPVADLIMEHKDDAEFYNAVNAALARAWNIMMEEVERYLKAFHKHNID